MKLSVVSYLDPASTKEIRALQETLSVVTGSKAALNSWMPHITLGDGIEIPNTQFKEVGKVFETFATHTQPFTVSIDGIDTFEHWHPGNGDTASSFVIYASVQTSPDLLNIVKALKPITSAYPIWYHMPEPYQPHITLAFRDLSEEGFRRGMAFLKGKELALTATLKHIALVEKLPNTDTERVRFLFQSQVIN